MPLFTPPLQNAARVQIDPDNAGDWVKIGDSPWWRMTESSGADGSPVYIVQVRRDDGQIRDVAKSGPWPG